MRVAAALAALALAACASGPSPKSLPARDGRYALVLAESEPVPFQGVLTLDDAGLKSAPILYGPGPAAFIAGLVTHGTLLKSFRESQKSDMQVEADKVLAPYTPILASFHGKDLVDASLAPDTGALGTQLERSGATVKPSWIITSSPVFSMTQDQHAIVIDNVVAIVRADDTSKIVYQNNVSIVSSTVVDADATAYWSENNGERLKAEGLRLFRESLELALRDSTKPIRSSDMPQQTVRYREGRIERMERADILEQTCDRALIRNLRGWLMSVPLEQPPDACVVNVAR